MDIKEAGKELYDSLFTEPRNARLGNVGIGKNELIVWFYKKKPNDLKIPETFRGYRVTWRQNVGIPRPAA